jgi:hypothetical protein
MKVRTKIVIVSASMALGVAPAFAVAAGPPSHPGGPPATVTTGPPAGVTTGPPSGVTTGQPSSVPPSNQGTAHKPTNPGSQGTQTSNQPGASASLPAKAKAYGRYCKSESKQHVAGEKGTPFSQCVTAMAKLATGNATSPQTACRAESKQHTTGQRGTPFSLCVSGAAKLLKTEDSGTQSGSAA